MVFYSAFFFGTLSAKASADHTRNTALPCHWHSHLSRLIFPPLFLNAQGRVPFAPEPWVRAAKALCCPDEVRFI